MLRFIRKGDRPCEILSYIRFTINKTQYAMKRYFILLLIAPLLFACGAEETNQPDPALEKLKDENLRLLTAATEKDSSINAFVRSLNEIEENLAMIKEKERIVSTHSQNEVEFGQTVQDNIINDIQLINDLMEKNKGLIASLKKQLGNANLQIGEFEKLVERLTVQIQEKDAEIATLKEDLAQMNIAMELLSTEYSERVEEVAQKEDELNKAFYAFGTKKELTDAGVITKEGGFIGIGRADKLREDFNKEYFTEIDVRETTSIPLLSKKAKIITTHPSSAYSIEGEDRADKLTISNTEEFWSASKYLVVVVDN